MNKVLIIDDDKELCALMKKCIEQEKLSAVTVYNGIEGVRLIDENKDSYSLIILDVMLPDIDGFQILQKIRDTSNIPVLMLTAKSSEEDKVFGLRLGADDYLTKPFGINELLARVNSLIRRYTTLNPFTADIDSISLKDMVIDKLNRTVTVKDIPVLLTGKEFDLLLFLASNKGRVFTKKQIYSQVWEEEYAFDDSNIMSFISKLRKKIEPDPDHPFYILTVRGVGYRVNKEAEHGYKCLSFHSDSPYAAYYYVSPFCLTACADTACADKRRLRGYKGREFEPTYFSRRKRYDKNNLL